MPVISFDNLTYGCASARYLGPYAGTIEDMDGPFSANTPATITGTFDGSTRTGIQLEGSRQNMSLDTGALDSWSANALDVAANTTDLVDPLGGNASEKLTPTTANTWHAVSRNNAILNDNTWTAGYYAFGAFAAKGNSNYRNAHSTYHGTWHYVAFDLSDFSFTYGTGYTDYGAPVVGDWGRCWVAYYQAAGGPGTVRNRWFVWNGTADESSYEGDGSYIYGWGVQWEFARFLSSYIPTTSAAVTRAADNAYWGESDVPSALREKITVYVIPEFSSHAIYDEDIKHTVFHFDDTDQDIKIYFEKGSSADTGRIVVMGASALLTTGNHTWSEGQLLKLVIDPENGEITTSLFTTGNDTHSDTPWATTDGDVYLGQSASNTEHFFGVVFGPEYEGEEPPVTHPDNALFFSRCF